jgi:hypothetical protein
MGIDRTAVFPGKEDCTPMPAPDHYTTELIEPAAHSLASNDEGESTAARQ